ncbi:MAG TPA: ATP-binding protein [Bryobacteraceae bacterium]|nr:ATP-binding protein [Bryobacteraceae bacterium]
MIECNYDKSEVVVILDEEIHSSRHDIEAVLRRLMDQISGMPCSDGHVREIELALAEALANAIVHGNREDPDKYVHVWAGCVKSEQLILAITDQGEGFDLDSVPDPTTAENIYSTHGRGIFLMNCLMDSAEHRLGGRQVIMRKRMKRASIE